MPRYPVTIPVFALTKSTDHGLLTSSGGVTFCQEFPPSVVFAIKLLVGVTVLVPSPTANPVFALIKSMLRDSPPNFHALRSETVVVSLALTPAAPKTNRINTRSFE